MPAVTIPKTDSSLTSDAILNNLQANINIWEKRVQSLRQEKERANSPDTKAELAEIDQLSKFLKGRLTIRLQAIKKYPEDLRIKYLKCIEPFYTEEGITRFMGHYFEVEVFKQVRLRFRKKKDFEKEVNVLFDLYKVKRTIETITTLQNSVASKESFPSQFEKPEQAEFLKVLKEIFKLFFLRFVKKEYRKEVFQTLSEAKLDLDAIISMRKSGVSYIKPEIFETTEYRDKFITVFFSTLLRTKTSVEIKDLHFNYLNFELLKNEFLSDWMQRKLRGNPEKDKVLQDYKIGGKSVTQLIKENPEQEAEIMANLPIDIFNDIAEQVNQKVKDEDKTPVSTFSKNHGVLARIQSTFVQVKQIARFSIEKMEEMRPKTGIWTVKKKQTEPPNPSPPREEPQKELKVLYGLEVLKIEDLDFPFFDKRYETYKPKIEYLQKKMGTDYETFSAKVWQLFDLVSKEHLIIRKDPCHEWVIPFLFSHGSNLFLLLIGAEIVMKDQQAGYQSRWKSNQSMLNCYYVLATQKVNDNFGKVLDKRLIKKTPFFQYSFANKSVHQTAMTLLGRAFQAQDKDIFKASNLTYRNPENSFSELDDLKVALGLVNKNENEETVENQPETPTQNTAPAVAPEEKPKVHDIRQVAEELKKELEEAKKNPPPLDPNQTPKKPTGMNALADQIKQEMVVEKLKKQTEAQSAAPQKVKDIRQVASELKQELK